jgi:pimeloyl-[acyl-carrier protein] methyl ester esterase
MTNGLIRALAERECAAPRTVWNTRSAAERYPAPHPMASARCGATMLPRILLLLPGMDGTGRLLERLAFALSPRFQTHVVRYPVDRILDYDELLERIELPKEPFAVVAESFSGPLGIRVAAARRKNLTALILAGSFARSPWPRVPGWLSVLAHPIVFRAPPPGVLLRRTLLDVDSSADTVKEVRSVLASVQPNVLAGRLRAIASVDVRAEFANTTTPTLYLHGARDRLVPERVRLELSRLRPDLEEVLLDAPHLMLQERPQEAAAAITSFVDRAANRSPSQATRQA